MVKATGEWEGRPLTVFGIDPENVKRLREGKPIRVDMAELGRPEVGIVLIMFGETHARIAELLGAGQLFDEPKGSA